MRKNTDKQEEEEDEVQEDGVEGQQENNEEEEHCEEEEEDEVQEEEEEKEESEQGPALTLDVCVSVREQAKEIREKRCVWVNAGNTRNSRTVDRFRQCPRYLWRLF